MTSAPADRWDRFPERLTALRQWCVAAPDKAPWSVGRGRASVNDPSTWTDFETAVHIATTWDSRPGIMLQAGGQIVVIDVDIKEDATAEDIVRRDRIIETFDSYTELSQSGRGVHIFLEGDIGPGRRRDGIEVYGQGRFIVCTGNVIRDVPIRRRDAQLQPLLSEMGEPIPEASLWGEDTTYFQLATDACMDTGELGRLFKGDWQGRYPSQSEADLALVVRLLPNTESPRECWNTFRLSALGRREKASRSDYARSTLSAASDLLRRDAEQIEHGRQIATAFGESASSNANGAGLVSAIEPPPDSPVPMLAGPMNVGGPLALHVVDWVRENDVEVPDLIEGLVADEDVTLLGGHGGAGKSFLALQMACAVALGSEILGRETRQSRVLYYSAEDGKKRLTRRLRRATETFSYDFAKLQEWLRVLDASELEPLYGETTELSPDGRRFSKFLGPRADYTNLQKMVEAFDPQLVVVDGASDTFDGNEIARREVRAFIKLLRSIHPHRRVAVLLLVHIDRASARGHVSDDEGYSGSGQWHNSARRRLYLQLKLERDRETKEVTSELLLLRVVKNQDGPPDPDMELVRGPHGLLHPLLAQFGGALAPIEEDHGPALLALIKECNDKGVSISVSLAPQATTGVYATLKEDPRFPNGLNKKKTAALVRRLEGDGLLQKEAYSRGNRGTAERWAVVSND